MTGKTVSSVRNACQESQRRWQVFAQDECAINAIGIFAQLWIGFSLYCYDHVGTPGWISLLLTFPYPLLLIFLGLYLLRRAEPGVGPIDAAVGENKAAPFHFIFALLHFSDAFLAFYALSAIMADVMPDLSVWEIDFAVSLLCAASLGKNAGYTLPRLAGFLKWLIGALLLYCLIIAVPYGKPSHFFPLLGYGPLSIGKAALWMCGAFSSAASPLLTSCQEERTILLRQKRTVLFPVFCAFLFGLIAYGFSIWLLPIYAMFRPASLGWRLLLITHMTPSIPAWSMEVIGLALLLLLSICRNVSLSSGIMARGMKKNEPRSLPALLLLMMAVPCALNSDSIQRFVLLIAALRSFAAFFILALLCTVSLYRRRKAADA